MIRGPRRGQAVSLCCHLRGTAFCLCESTGPSVRCAKGLRWVPSVLHSHYDYYGVPLCYDFEKAVEYAR